MMRKLECRQTPENGMCGQGPRRRETLRWSKECLLVDAATSKRKDL
mgnify:CR=1 FL=1